MDRAGELDDTAFDENDKIFRQWDGWQPKNHGFTMSINVHETIPTGNPYVKREKIVRGNNLARYSATSRQPRRNGRRKSAKEIVALGIQHYAAQIFAPIVPAVVQGKNGVRSPVGSTKASKRFGHITGSLQGRSATEHYSFGHFYGQLAGHRRRPAACIAAIVACGPFGIH